MDLITDLAGKLSPTEIVALASAVIALAALAIAIWQGYLNRIYFRLSVRPHLDLNILSHPQKPFCMEIINNGLGPALIRDVVLVAVGEVILVNEDSRIEQAFSRYGASDFGIMYHTNFIPHHISLLPREKIELLSILDVGISSRSLGSINDAYKNMGIFIRYFSMYEEGFYWKKNVKWYLPIQLAFARLKRRWS